jgi:hypothetical protein
MKIEFRRVPFWIILVLILIPARVRAQENGYPFRIANFGLEIFGGYSKINPQDFNSLSRYEEAYLKFFFIDKYQFLYGGNATVLRTGDAAIGSIDRTLPWGARLTYRASPTLTLSLGIQRVTAERRAAAGVVVAGPGGEGAEYRLPDYSLTASAWIPELQASFGWPLLPILRFEVFLGGGPMLTRCRHRIERKEIATAASGDRTETSMRMDIEGRNTGVAGELGVRLRLRPVKFLSLFAEGGLAFRHTAELRGPGSLQTIFIAAGAEPVIEAKTWDEKLWCMVPYDIILDWGQFSGIVAGNSYSQTAIPFATRNGWGYQLWGYPSGFSLDFSGLQFKAGVALGF